MHVRLPIPHDRHAAELWRSKLTRGGRIVFEVAADFSEEQHQVGLRHCLVAVSLLWVPCTSICFTPGGR